jgi:hypothetical protein
MSEIEWPQQIEGLSYLPGLPGLSGAPVGSWVSVRPCGEEYGGKTYLGIYLGDLAVNPVIFLKEDQTLEVMMHQNPAMYVPDLKEVIWGMGSWWGRIDSPEGLRKITDADIENIWYVKALKELSEGSNAKGGE